MPAEGFDYDSRRDGTMVITRRGARATVLRGVRAEEFLAEVEGDPQGVMAHSSTSPAPVL